MNASRAVRARRRDVLGVGLRYVANETERLAQTNPEDFAPLSHGTLSRIENSDGRWFTRMVDVRVVQALVEVLWGGDYQAFVRDTRLPLPLPLYAEHPPRAPITPALPYHLEGEHPSLYARSRRTLSPPYPGVDFALGATSTSMSPLPHPGQVAWCVRDPHPDEGQVAVLLRAAGLQPAWTLPGGRYATERDLTPFDLKHGESVYATVAYIEPRDPNLPARLTS